jgi:AI-2 transport protein TqsA
MNHRVTDHPAHHHHTGEDPPRDIVPPNHDRGLRTTNSILLVIATILAIVLLREARLVFIPLALAAFLTMLVWPVRDCLSRRFPGWAAATLTTLLVLAVAAAISIGLWLLAARVSHQFDSTHERLVEQYQNILQWWQSRGMPIEWLSPGSDPQTKAAVEAAARGDEEATRSIVATQTTRQIVAFFTSGLGTLLGVIAMLGLTAGLMALMLLELPRWRNRLESVYGPELYLQTYDSFGKSAIQFRRYLIAQTISGAAAGALTGLLCWGMGVPLALLWGVLSFLFNYIPNIGVFISGIPTTILAFATLGPGEGMLFLTGLVLIEIITANLLAPLVQGGTMILSPVEALVALIFWSWMWGVAGALLSVPITAALVVVLRHIYRLRPLGKFLSD